MKQKIAEALKTKYKSFGLSNEAFDRIASAKKETVTKEEEIADAIADVETMNLIAQELQKMRDSEIQKRTDLQREHDNYKATHPDVQEGDSGDGSGKNDDDDEKPLTAKDIKKIVEEATASAVKSVKDDLDAYKSQNSAKEAVINAKKTFYANKWTEKFPDEATDAWDRVHELNEAKGGTMTEEELSAKAKEYFESKK